MNESIVIKPNFRKDKERGRLKKRFHTKVVPKKDKYKRKPKYGPDYFNDLDKEE